MKEREKKF